MKKLIIPLAVYAVAVLTSCNSDINDSYTKVKFGEYNLITDLQNPEAPVQVSSSTYDMKLNLSKDCADIVTSDLVINNQKISFETDTMAFRLGYLVSENNTSYVEVGSFGKTSNVGKGATVTDLSAQFTNGIYYCSTPYIPEFTTTATSPGMRLILGYDLNERYHVQTFWPMCYYMGKSYVYGSETFTTSNTAYRVELNFEKNTARVAVYNPEFSVNDAENNVPQAIVMEEIPIKFNHNTYSLEASAPKTRVLGKKDNIVALVESEQYQATDFLFTIGSEDLTEAVITYKIDGKRINFTGCSIVKASNPSN